MEPLSLGFGRFLHGLPGLQPTRISALTSCSTWCCSVLVSRSTRCWLSLSRASSCSYCFSNERGVPYLKLQADVERQQLPLAPISTTNEAEWRLVPHRTGS